MKRQFLSLALILVSLPAQANELFLDAVVASINGQAVTLNEVESRLRPVRRLTLSEFAQDTEARYALDQVISERLIEAEAKEKNISVSETDVDSYVNEVASQNGMSLQDFKKALTEENIPFDFYRTKARLDILKSRLASSLFREGSSVTEEEINSYLKENPELVNGEEKVKLRQILVAFNAADSEQGRPESSVIKVIDEIQKELGSGADFGQLAAKYSSTPDAKDGGSLGLVNLSDLSPVIQDAIILLKPGQVSTPVKTAQGIHLFQLQERFESSPESLHVEIRSQLEKQKMEEKIAKYFSLELYKKHSVEKKV